MVIFLFRRYITANSCSPPGYSEYFNDYSLPSNFWNPGLGLCNPPYPQDGSRNSVHPEQFFNCAEGMLNDWMSSSSLPGQCAN